MKDYPVDGDWKKVEERIEGGALQNFHRNFLSRFKKEYGRDPEPWEDYVPGLYLNIRGLNPYMPIAGDWFPLWRGTLFGGYDTLRYFPSLVEYRAWTWNEWIKRGFVKGVYFDDCWANPQRIVPGTCAYLMEDGTPQPGYSFLGEREYLKRVRQICVDHNVFPHICAHSTHTFFIPYHSFFDVLLDGEDHYRTGKEKNDFMDVWPLARVRFNNAQKWGITTSWLGWSNDRMKPPEDQPDWVYKQTRAFTATLLLHDIIWNKNERFSSTSLDPDKMREIKLYIDPDTEFFPYWDPQGIAEWSNAESIKVGVWKRKELCAIVVVNHSTNKLEAEVKLSLKNIGFNDASSDKLKLEDIDTKFIGYFPKSTKPKTSSETVPFVGEGAEDIEKLFEEEASSKKKTTHSNHPDAAFRWQNGTIKCVVRPHDYRFFVLKQKAVGE